jgi:hypothetical protein
MQQNQSQVEWRRAKVMELLSKGESNQSGLCISIPTEGPSVMSRKTKDVFVSLPQS